MPCCDLLNGCMPLCTGPLARAWGGMFANRQRQMPQSRVKTFANTVT
ncbi:hypothetical protein BIFGAL_03619 [Bifidobacterium gallicum DSM 20093 = LMG 11596]|uniref:Uncharacterized protein n=1 Tax=Bifidobacterium gallicum DSM 20093 = LMG 11596 TaxID=561180 RepID=D1NUU2_9BIFI|nr:hypothetical protein BIFGAL_03619 [Bifidobacterium gallicum DSM 20093 = LMG 11596]